MTASAELTAEREAAAPGGASSQRKAENEVDAEPATGDADARDDTVIEFEAAAARLLANVDACRTVLGLGIDIDLWMLIQELNAGF